eukprot:gnl/MRDRNA2_/MRDRNA2_33734_c0_seq1.p1 gnl/MRDRNA2_/MRDRNA2_33734_c0~~gnl/MRDRNA2_/MRDRNA2_33734_c0_seq1.p1  ORF type:complete len:651 (-),score=131.79 gnl/MRDRNA2_/MRDRNA2_33734_c0_seq1:54-2006(-)
MPVTSGQSVASTVPIEEEDVRYAVVKASGGRLTVTLDFRGKELNFNREADEPLERVLSRVKLSCLKTCAPRKRKRTPLTCEPDSEADQLEVCLQRAKGDYEGKPCLCEQPLSSAAGPAFEEADSLRIGAEVYQLLKNPPIVERLELPQHVFVGCPVIAYLKTQCALKADFALEWVVEWPGISGTVKPTPIVGPIYTPCAADAGGLLRVRAFHKTARAIGTTMATRHVESLPGDSDSFCRRRLQKWFNETGKSSSSSASSSSHSGNFRVCTFNILAPMYTRSDTVADRFYPYCSPKHLDFEYRRHLLAYEILSVDSDILCLQECSSVFLSSTLRPLLGESYHLSFRQKTQCSGESEGCAMAVRKSRFDVLGRFDVESLTQKLLTDPALKKLLEQLRPSMPGLEEEVLPRLKTLAQVVVLKEKEVAVDGRHRILIVANTHLFYHPGAPHVRLLQVVALLEQVKAVEEKYRAEGPIGLVLAGDFNSLPGSAVVRLLESGHVNDDDPEWAQGSLFRWGQHCPRGDEDNLEEEAAPEQRFETETVPCVGDAKRDVRGITLSHPFQLQRAWSDGELAFTNFVACFRGVLDHVFIDTSVMEVRHKIDGAHATDIEEKYGGLPNAVYGSDHLAMACDLAWKQTPAGHKSHEPGHPSSQ